MASTVCVLSGPVGEKSGGNVGGWGFIRAEEGWWGQGGKRLPGCIIANVQAISSGLLNIYTLACIWNSASLYIHPAGPRY